MTLPAPDALTRAISHAFGTRDAAGFAALFAEDAEFLSLTGAAAEGRAAIEAVVAGEFAGAFARARLVTGRLRVRPVVPGVAVVMQRFVLSGLVHADGSDAGRVGALLCATLAETPEGWQVVVATFTAES